MTITQSKTPACHNCRRRRWKCDRSLPHCVKCSTSGQVCLGYQRLLRWEPGVASRGKMMGKTFGGTTESETALGCFKLSSQFRLNHLNVQRRTGTLESLLYTSLSDPLVQDLDSATKMYISHFSSNVCKDLVLYDVPEDNAFRELIPWTHHHPMLLNAIIASSALHMFNICRIRSVVAETSSKHYEDALVAKQKALCMLRYALQSVQFTQTDVILAVVLLLVEVELIDSGRNNWRSHVKGANAIIESLCSNMAPSKTAFTPLRICLLSNCLVFDIIGSTLTSSETPEASDPASTNTLSLLQDAEGNHCSSFPAHLLRLVQIGSQLHSSNGSKQDQALVLLQSAQSFDPSAWASNLQTRSPTPDLIGRTNIASAHRAAVCVYLSRILLSFKPSTNFCGDLESLVDDVIDHLSLIHSDDSLFTATTWPAFVAGAETKDSAKQDWVARRFKELWDVEPWGLNREALGVLERMWMEGRRRKLATELQEPEADCNTTENDWVAELKNGRVDWLVI